MSNDILNSKRAFLILDNLAMQVAEKHPQYRAISFERTLKEALNVDLTSSKDRTRAFLEYVAPTLDFYFNLIKEEAQTREEVYALRKRFIALSEASVLVMAPLDNDEAWEKLMVYTYMQGAIEHIYKGWKAARNADTVQRQAAIVKNYPNVIQHNKNILRTMPKIE